MAFVGFPFACQSRKPLGNPRGILNAVKPPCIERQVLAFQIRYPSPCRDRIREKVTRLKGELDHVLAVSVHTEFCKRLKRQEFNLRQQSQESLKGHEKHVSLAWA